MCNNNKNNMNFNVINSNEFETLIITKIFRELEIIYYLFPSLRM